MKLIHPSYKIEFHPYIENVKLIEAAARTCYKSQPTDRSAIGRMRFIRGLTHRGHLSVIEHSLLSVRFIIDRGVSHELVRHRLCAFSQESTRYCNYSKEDEIEIIQPFFFDPFEEKVQVQVPSTDYGELKEKVLGPIYRTYEMNSFDVWFLACLWSEWGYMTLINNFGRKAQEARSVLPNSLKTEIVVTANYREWMHIFSLRDHIAAHPQMREIMEGLHLEMKRKVPEVFA